MRFRQSVESTTADAVGLGATLIDRIDMTGVARMATLCDSEAAILGLWGPRRLRESNSSPSEEVWWIEVLSSRVSSAREFYCRLFGWTFQGTAFEPFASYTVFKRGDAQEGGLLPIGKDWGIAPRWNSIFAVDDCDATIEHAIRLGGCNEFIHTVPKTGRIGVVTDPGGASFIVRGPVR